MPRLMSVAHTEPQVRARSKTQTRRAGWSFLEPGHRVTLCPKAMGLRKGQRAERIVDVEVVDVRREPLEAITQADVCAEGFPNWSPTEFIAFFTAAMGGDQTQVVNRIEYRYLEPAADTIAAAITGTQFLFGDEAALQAGIYVALLRAGLQVTREISLNPSGRIDFLVDDATHGLPRRLTGVEVKVKGSSASVLAQLTRYAPHVDDLVLVTTRATHRTLPPEVCGKPLRVVLIRGAAW